MANVLICETPAVLPDNTITCAVWQTVPYESIALKTDLFPFEELLSFDMEIFTQVLLGLLLTFVTGHIAGSVVKYMNRT